MAAGFWRVGTGTTRWSGGGTGRAERRRSNDFGSYAGNPEQSRGPVPPAHDGILSREQQKVLSAQTDIELYGEDLGPVASPKTWRGASPPGNLQGFCQEQPHKVLLPEPITFPGQSYAGGFTQQPANICGNAPEHREYPRSGAVYGSRHPGEPADFNNTGMELPRDSPNLRMSSFPATCYPGRGTTDRMMSCSPVNSETCVFSDYAGCTGDYEATGSAVAHPIDKSELQPFSRPDCRDPYDAQGGRCNVPLGDSFRWETEPPTGSFQSEAYDNHRVATQRTPWPGEGRLHYDDYVRECPPEGSYSYSGGFPTDGSEQMQPTTVMPDRQFDTTSLERPSRAWQHSKAVFTHASDTGPPFSFCSTLAWVHEIAFARGSPAQLTRYAEFASIALDVRERCDPVLPIFQDEEHKYCKACGGFVVHWQTHFESDYHRRAMGLPPLLKPPPERRKVQKWGAACSVATWTRESQVGPPVSYFSSEEWSFQMQGLRGADTALFRGRTLDDLGCNDPQLIIRDDEQGRYCRHCNGLLVCPPFHTCLRRLHNSKVSSPYTVTATDMYPASFPLPQYGPSPMESLHPDHRIREGLMGEVYDTPEDGGALSPEAGYVEHALSDCDERYLCGEEHNDKPAILEQHSSYLLQRIQELKNAEGQLEMRAKQLGLGMETATLKVKTASRTTFMHATGIGPPIVHSSNIRWKDQVKLVRGDEECLKVEHVKDFVNIILEVREKDDPILPIAPEEEKKYCRSCRGLVVHWPTHGKSDNHRKAMGLPPLKWHPPAKKKKTETGPPVTRCTWTRECKDGPPIAFWSKSRWGSQPKGVRGQKPPPIFVGHTLDDMEKNDSAVTTVDNKGQYCDFCSGLLVHPPSHRCPVQDGRKSQCRPQILESAVESPWLPGLGPDFSSVTTGMPALLDVSSEHKGGSEFVPDGTFTAFPDHSFQEGAGAPSGDLEYSFESGHGYGHLSQEEYAPSQKEVTQGVEILSMQIEELKRKEQNLDLQAKALQKKFQRPKRVATHSKTQFTHATSTGHPVSYCTTTKWKQQTRPLRGTDKPPCEEFATVVLDIREEGDPILPIAAEEAKNYCKDCGVLVVHQATHKKSDKHRAALGLAPLPKPVNIPSQRPSLRKGVQKASKATWTRENKEGPPVAYVNGSRWAMQAKGIRGEEDLYSVFKGRTLDDLGRDDPVPTEEEEDVNKYCEACGGLLVHPESHVCPKAQPQCEVKPALLPDPHALLPTPTSQPLTGPLLALPPQLASGTNRGAYPSQFAPRLSGELPGDVGIPFSVIDEYSLRIRDLQQSERQLEIKAWQLETARSQTLLGKRKHPSAPHGIPTSKKKSKKGKATPVCKQFTSKTVFTNASETGPPVSFCSALRWRAQNKVLRTSTACPPYLEGATMSVREAGDPVLPITEEEKQKYCRDCGCLLVSRKAHFKSDFHRSKKGQPLLPKVAKPRPKQQEQRRVSISMWTRESKVGPPISYASRSKWQSQHKGMRVYPEGKSQITLFKDNTLDDIGRNDPLLEVSEEEKKNICPACMGLLVHPPSHTCPGYPVLQWIAKDKE